MEENLIEEHKRIQDEATSGEHYGSNHIVTAIPNTTPRYGSFNEAMRSIKSSPRFAPTISAVTPKTLKELFDNYNKIHSELLVKEAEGKEAEGQLTALFADIRETESKIRLAKDRKNKALDALDREAIMSVNSELELLGHRKAKLEALVEPLATQKQALQENINRLRESLIYPKRFLLRTIAEDLRDKILSKCQSEIKSLAAINASVIGTTKLSKLFADTDVKIDDAESIINSMIAGYAKTFEEGKKNDTKF